MIRRPPRSTQSRSSAASDVYKRQQQSYRKNKKGVVFLKHSVYIHTQSLQLAYRRLAIAPARPAVIPNVE